MNNPEQQNEYQKLASKWLDGTITAEEKMKFAKWYNEGGAAELEIPEVFAANEQLHKERIFSKIKGQIFQEKKRILWPRLVAALFFIALFSSGMFFLRQNFFTQEPLAIIALEKNDFAAGKNMTVLTLADGNTLALADLKTGTRTRQNGAIITKNKDGQLEYQVMQDHAPGKETEYNTISTPKGGQYQINLPDGTKVWLNAASSLRFPTTFSKLGERKVMLSGEGYFEVAKDKNRPFKVVSDGQTVTVYGTHFNIYAYHADEDQVTTLIEGSVEVNGVRLQPNQQLVINKHELKVLPADVENVLAWKNGYFKFEDERLDAIMKRVSRWYDVEVEFNDPKLKELEFGIVTSRLGSLSKILKMLEMTHEVYFTIKDRKITVMNYQVPDGKR